MDTLNSMYHMSGIKNLRNVQKLVACEINKMLPSFAIVHCYASYSASGYEKCARIANPTWKGVKSKIRKICTDIYSGGQNWQNITSMLFRSFLLYLFFIVMLVCIWAFHHLRSQLWIGIAICPPSFHLQSFCVCFADCGLYERKSKHYKYYCIYLHNDISYN